MASKKHNLSEVDALVELERLGWGYQPTGDNEVRIKCPVHEDDNPSASLNVEKNVWKCYVQDCGAKGDIVALLAHIAKVDRRTMFVSLSERYPTLERQKTIPSTTVEKFHQRIWAAGPLLSRLRSRAVTDVMIRAARLGYHDGRVTIPVMDEHGRCVNVRRYLPGAPGPEKMLNTTGHAGPHLYQKRDVLDYEEVWILGGEIKALVAKHMLNSKGVGACSATGGEGSWKHEWTPMFKDKRVLVCMDVDATGTAAARKLATLLHDVASQVKVIKLPLDPKDHPKGDFNDWAATGVSAEDVIAHAESSPEWTPPESKPKIADLRDSPLAEVSRGENVGYRMRTVAVVSALDPTPFIIPKTIGVTCTKDQPLCHQCQVKVLDPDPDTGYVDLLLPTDCPVILDMVGGSRKEQRELIREGLSIPVCKAVKFVVKDNTSVLDVRLSPRLEISGERTSDVMQPALVVDKTVELNEPYEMLGNTIPSPRTQQAVFLVNKVSESNDTLETFEPSESELDALRQFSPEKLTVANLSSKLDEIYEDLESNVTWIFKRRDMHLALDLAWHSVLLIPFDGRTINGWMNTLIIGDSSQGKSETALRLMEHYGLGERVDCKNSTVAGLLGGLEQMGSRWFVKWGVIPVHDRRLVVLEEIKGMPPEVFSKLTDMRSSGVAEIPKIERRKTHARTRLVFISNPRKPRPIQSYSFGIEAVHELVGSMEDMRRFDFVLIASKEQVDAEETHALASNRPKVEHKATSELCRRLVLWAWTRSAEQIVFRDAAMRRLLAESLRMCKKFSESMPLVDRGTMKHKLARMAAAVAARTFSTEDGQSLLVCPEHAEWAVKFIDSVYSDPVFGYEDFSVAKRATEKLTQPESIKKHLKNTRHPADFVKQMLHRDEITLIDIQDWCELGRDDAAGVMSFLVRKHALKRATSRVYHKTPEFIGMLKHMVQNGLMETAPEDHDDF